MSFVRFHLVLLVDLYVHILIFVVFSLNFLEYLSLRDGNAVNWKFGAIYLVIWSGFLWILLFCLFWWENNEFAEILLMKLKLTELKADIYIYIFAFWCLRYYSFYWNWWSSFLFVILLSFVLPSRTCIHSLSYILLVSIREYTKNHWFSFVDIRSLCVFMIGILLMLVLCNCRVLTFMR